MPVKLIIFDLDGTLVDAAEDIAVALNRAIEPHGLGPLGVEETKALVGDGTTRLIEKALSPLGARADAEVKKAALQTFLDYYAAHLAVHSKAYPGVKDVLWKLSNFDKAVLSNKQEALSRGLLEELGIAGAFRLIAGSDTVTAKKPSPEGVQYVLGATGTAPEDALMVGDSPLDVEAARAAGVRAVAVTYGYRDRGLLGGADFMLDDIMELMPLLLKIKAIEEKRREPRYSVSPACRKYIEVRVKSEGGRAPAEMLDLSGRGLMLRSALPLEPGADFECEVSIPESLTHAVEIRGTVRHCEPYERNYVVGVEIQGVSSDTWFRVFKKVCDFISERGGVY